MKMTTLKEISAVFMIYHHVIISSRFPLEPPKEAKNGESAPDIVDVIKNDFNTVCHYFPSRSLLFWNLLMIEQCVCEVLLTIEQRFVSTKDQKFITIYARAHFRLIEARFLLLRHSDPFIRAVNNKISFYIKLYRWVTQVNEAVFAEDFAPSNVNDADHFWIKTSMKIAPDALIITGPSAPRKNALEIWSAHFKTLAAFLGRVYSNSFSLWLFFLTFYKIKWT